MVDILGDFVSNVTRTGGNLISGAQSVGGDVTQRLWQGLHDTTGLNITPDTGSQTAWKSTDPFREGVSFIKRGSSGAFKTAGKLQRTGKSLLESGTAKNLSAPIAVPAGILALGASAVQSYLSKKTPENDAGVIWGGSRGASFTRTAPANQGASVEKITSTTPPATTISTVPGLAEDNQGFTATWSETKSNRPAYKAVDDLGLDTQTWKLVSQGYTPLQAVNERIKTETNPTTLRQLDWQRLQLAQNAIELSSEYHNWAKDTEVSRAINPYEAQGDMALALKSGIQQEGKLQIAGANPEVSDLFADLPRGGLGLEDVSWFAAKSGFTTKDKPDFTAAINRLESSKNKLGVYGGLNANRDYTEWNTLRGAKVSSPTAMEILTGTTYSKTFSRKKNKANSNLDSDLISEDLVLGFPQGRYKPKQHKPAIKKAKVCAYTESALLREMGITSAKKQNAKKSKPAKKQGKTEKTFWGI